MFGYANEVRLLNDMAKNLILWVVIALVLMSVFNNFGPRRTSTQAVTYSQFIADVKMGQVQKVVIEGRHIQGIRQTSRPGPAGRN